MDTDTKAELIERGSSMVASLLKGALQTRAESKRREENAELRKELAEIKFGDGSLDGGESEVADPPEEREPPTLDEITDSTDALDRALAEINDYDALLEQAAAAEECPVCERMIRAVQDQPVRFQNQMLPELREFLAEKDGQVSKPELKESLQNKPALLQLVEAEFGE